MSTIDRAIAIIAASVLFLLLATVGVLEGMGGHEVAAFVFILIPAVAGILWSVFYASRSIRN